MPSTSRLPSSTYPDLEHFWLRTGHREMLPVAGETLGGLWAEAHETDRKETLAKAMARRPSRSSSPTTPACGRSARRGSASCPPAPPTPSPATPTSPPPPSCPPE